MKCAKSLLDNGSWQVINETAFITINGMEILGRALLRKTPEDLEELQIKVADLVEDDDEPTDEMKITGFQIHEVDGAPIRSHIFEMKTLDEYRNEARALLDARYEEERTARFAWDFGAVEKWSDAGENLGAAGLQELQMSDRDIAAWQSTAQVAALSQPDAPVWIRPFSNVWLHTTATDVLKALLAGEENKLSAYRRQAAILIRYTALKAFLAAVDTLEEITATRALFNEGWPVQNT